MRLYIYHQFGVDLKIDGSININGKVIFEDKELIEIKSNLEQILTSQNYVSTSGGSDISGRMGVRDTYYDLDKKILYVSLITKNTNDCFGIGILKADASELFNKASLIFDIYYKTTSCAANTNFMPVSYTHLTLPTKREV